MSVHDDTNATGNIMRQPRRGFTLIEASICSVLVSALLLASLSTLGASARTYHDRASRQAAILLAQDLMTEILQHGYRDDLYPGTIGPEPDENALDRRTFDDVDDYAGLIDAPPTLSDGAPVANAAGFERSVTVYWVRSDNFKVTAPTDSGVKRIRVEVTKDGQSLAILYAGRAQL